MRMNFFAKLVILVLTLTVSATGIMGYILLTGMEESLKMGINREVQAQVTGLAENIEAMLQEKTIVGPTIAANRQVVDGDPAGISALLDAIEKGDSASHEAINITDRTGRIIHFAPAANAGNMLGASVADRQYFKDAMQTGRTVISDVIISRDTGKPVIIIASPIKDGGGNFAGIVSQVVRLDTVEKLRARVKIGETGYAGISTNINGKSIMIAHPNQDFVKEQKNVADVAIVKATMNGEKQLMAFKSVNGAMSSVRPI